jgi:hypothetical protein
MKYTSPENHTEIYGKAEEKLHAFLTSTFDSDDYIHTPALLPSCREVSPVIRCIGGRGGGVYSQFGYDCETEDTFRCQEWNPNCPPRSKSL